MIFGELLRHHRQTRRFSQLQLALEANVSTRHLSFIETGRANPSREMVLLLGSVLDVPLRERNTLLEAAGFAPIYRESPLDGPSAAEMRRAVTLILRRHEPYGAVALDRHWNVILANEAYVRVHHHLLGDDGLRPYVAETTPRVNVIRDFFRPDGMRRHVANWADVARAMVPRIQREAAGNDEVMRALAQEVLAYPGVPAPRAATTGPVPLLIPVEMRMGEVTLRLFTTIATVGTAQDITLSEMRIESFHPMDDATDAIVKTMFAEA